jgi:transcriptional regulator with XRE-family HTH domain
MTRPPLCPEAKNLGEALRILRHSRNLTLRELGALCGKMPANLSRHENGSLLPRYDSLLRIMEALDLPMTALLETQQHLCDLDGTAPGKYAKEEKREEPPEPATMSRETALRLAQEAGKAVAHCCLAFLEFQAGGWSDTKVIANGRQEGGRR